MNDFKNMSDRYRQQMLDLYKRYPKNVPSQTKATEKNVADTPINSPIENTQPIETIPETPTTIQEPIPIQNTQSMENQETIPNEDNIPIEEKYPEPILPPFIYQANHSDSDTTIVPNESKSEPTDLPQFGYLKVVTTSAEGTIPLDNVSVIVSKLVDNHEEIFFTLITNASGETTIVELPAPSKSLSQSPSDSMVKPYAEYNISAYLDGYFQVINTKVPIFSGITSIQNINMIPLPSYTDERKVITMTIEESEPNL